MKTSLNYNIHHHEWNRRGKFEIFNRHSYVRSTVLPSVITHPNYYHLLTVSSVSLSLWPENWPLRIAEQAAWDVLIRARQRKPRPAGGKTGAPAFFPFLSSSSCHHQYSFLLFSLHTCWSVRSHDGWAQEQRHAWHLGIMMKMRFILIKYCSKTQT